MYTENQLKILDTEEYLDFIRSQLKDINDPHRLDWANMLIKNLELKLEGLYSLE